MSGYKNGRLSKKDYLAMLVNDRKSEKSCHKKKNGPNFSLNNGSNFSLNSGSNFSMNNGLRCSRDQKNNIYCAVCKILLIPNNTQVDSFQQKVESFKNITGVDNCCYDCGFSWFCNKCSFMLYRKNTGYFPTCFQTFALKLKDNNYNRGRYSNFDDETWKCLREFFEYELKHNRAPKGMLVDKDFLLEIYKQPNYKVKFGHYRNAIKNVYAKLKKCDLSIYIDSIEKASEYRPTIENIKEEYEKILLSKIKKNSILVEQDTEEDSDATDSESNIDV